MAGAVLDQFVNGEIIPHQATRNVTETDDLLFFALTHDEQTRVVKAFAISTDGIVSLDRQMFDKPHVKQAHRLLDTAAQTRSGR